MESNPIVQNDANAALIAAIEELRGYEKKNYQINRIKLIILAVCLVICIAAAIFTFGNLGTLIKNVNTAAEVLTEAGNNINTLATDLEKMEFEKLGKSLSNIVEISEDTIGEIHLAVGGLDKLVKDADEAMQHINSVNFEDLNTGIRNLNDALAPIAKFFNIFP